MVNAWLLFKLRYPARACSLLKFKEDLILEMVQDYLEGINQELGNNPIENRIIKGLHRIERRIQRNCAYCSTEQQRFTSVFYCTTCNENLCVVDCFYNYHTDINFLPRYKHRNV